MNTLDIALCYAKKAEQAKSRGKEFAMSFTYFANLKAQTHCSYSGTELKVTGPNGFSFERLNNDIGYVDGNVIVVTQELNKVRSDLNTSDDVLARIESHKESIQSRMKAVNSSKAKIGRLQKRLCKVRIVDSKVVEWTADLKGTTAAMEGTLKNIEAINVTISKLEIVAEGLKKFENLSKMDKYRVELGLALDAPMTKVLKQKMAYNLTDRV